MTTQHHPAEEVQSDRDSCFRCSHDRAAHGSYSSTTSPCHASAHLSVINGVLNATPCACRAYSRGYLRTAVAVVAILAGIWALFGALRMVTG